MESGLPSKELTDSDLDRFLEEGFLRLPGVVPKAVVEAGVKVIWNDLGQSPHDQGSWTQPVIALVPSDVRPFEAAFKNPRLFAAFDQLVGVGAWLPRPHLGLFKVRFPHPSSPDDTAWHIDVSFPPEGSSREVVDLDFSQWKVNVNSRDRALLMFFLYSDVDTDDGPTKIRVGSHLDVPRCLASVGPEGISESEGLFTLVEQASESRPVAFAMGNAGDVYLCHPFLVHAAQPVKGNRPRVMSQPPLASRRPFVLEGGDDRDLPSPVALAIRRGLAQK
jgi:hypothetical protein